MTRKTKIFALSIAALGLAPISAFAEQVNSAETALFQSASVSLQAAGETALSSHAGALAGVEFNDENGSGVYEAKIVDSAGMTWMVKVDAMTGQILAQGQLALMDDEGDDHDGAESDNDSDAESDEEAKG